MSSATPAAPRNKVKNTSRIFVKPSFKDFETYLRGREYLGDVKAMYDYFENTDWTVNGKPMKNWKINAINQVNSEANGTPVNQPTHNDAGEFQGKGDDPSQADPKPTASVTAITDANRKVVPLKDGHNRFQDHQFGSRIWTACPPSGTPQEHIWEPEYWVFHYRKASPLDLIEIKYDDASYYAMALVERVTEKGLHLYKIFERVLNPTDANEMDMGAFKVKWSGTVDKWIVIRKLDNCKVKSGIGSKTQAMVEAQRFISKQ